MMVLNPLLPLNCNQISNFGRGAPPPVNTDEALAPSSQQKGVIMIALTSNRKESLEQGYRKADYWLLQFLTNYGATDPVYPDMIAQQIQEKWRKSGSTRASCYCFASCDNDNDLYFVFVSRAGTRIKLSSIYSVISAFLDVARDQSAYAFPLNDKKLQEVLAHGSPDQIHQSIIVDYAPEDLAKVMDAVELHKQKRAEIEANAYGYYQPVEDPVNRYNVARMRNMLKEVYSCSLLHISGYKFRRYDRFEIYNVVSDVTGEVLYSEVTLSALGDALLDDYRNFDKPDYQKGGNGDGSNR